MWTFSIYLESVAILPQLFMISKTGEAESITSHYLFALGLYRGLYILNWVYRYYTEGFFDLIAIVAGCVQTVLYCDFFYLYITKGLLNSFLVYKMLTLLTFSTFLCFCEKFWWLKLQRYDIVICEIFSLIFSSQDTFKPRCFEQKLFCLQKKEYTSTWASIQFRYYLISMCKDF